MDLIRRLIDIGLANLQNRKLANEHIRTTLEDEEWENQSSQHSKVRSEEQGHSHIDQELAEYYSNLEIPYGSDIETVRSAWRRMMKEYHPDKYAQDEKRRRTADQLTAQLTHAYRKLEVALQKKEG